MSNDTLRDRLLSDGFRFYLEGVILDCGVTIEESERAAEAVQAAIRRLIGSEPAARSSEECRGCAELRAERDEAIESREAWQKTARHCNQRKDEMKGALGAAESRAAEQGRRIAAALALIKQAQEGHWERSGGEVPV